MYALSGRSSKASLSGNRICESNNHGSVVAKSRQLKEEAAKISKHQ